MQSPPFTRRDFLKLSASGMLGAMLAELAIGRAAAGALTQGRMTLSGMALYKEPAFKARKLLAFGRDEVVSITGEVTGDAGNPFNSTWYEINGEGYTYSGWVQPVASDFQRPVFDVPAGGRRLGEITVPFSITRLQPSLRAKNGHRIYFSSTHWVTEVTANAQEKSIWYKIYDEQLRASFFVDAADMRLVPPEELAPLSPDVDEASKHIHVDTATQSVTAFEDQKAVLAARCSTGGKRAKTPLGEFRTFHKGASIHMTNDGEPGAGGGYDLPGVPWVSFFTGTGVGFHGTYWHNDYGTRRSHGCINLTPADAKFLYRWTSPVVPADTQYLYLPGAGTHVEIISSNV